MRTPAAGGGAGRGGTDGKSASASAAPVVLIGGSVAAQRREEFGHQQQREQRRSRRGEPVGGERGAIVQRQPDQGSGHGEIQCGRGEERDAQHPHGASPQIRRRCGQRARLVLGTAGEDDGGDAAHAVEKPRLQPGHGQKLPARGDGGADASERHAERDEQSGSSQNDRSERVGEEGREQHQHRPDDGDNRGRQPAGEQPVKRFDPVHDGRGQLARMALPHQRRTSLQQAAEHVMTQAAASRGASRYGSALGGDAESGARQGESDEAGEQPGPGAAPDQGCGDDSGLGDGEQNQDQPQPHRRQRRSARAGRLLAHPAFRIQPGVGHVAVHIAGRRVLSGWGEAGKGRPAVPASIQASGRWVMLKP